VNQQYLIKGSLMIQTGRILLMQAQAQAQWQMIAGFHR
jgi:hypothetical protein